MRIPIAFVGLDVAAAGCDGPPVSCSNSARSNWKANMAALAAADPIRGLLRVLQALPIEEHV